MFKREDAIKCCVSIEAWSYQEEMKCGKLMKLLSPCCSRVFVFDLHGHSIWWWNEVWNYTCWGSNCEATIYICPCVDYGQILLSLLFSYDINCFPWPLAHLNCSNMILTSQYGFLTSSCYLDLLSRDYLFPPTPLAFLYFESFLLCEFFPWDFQRCCFKDAFRWHHSMFLYLHWNSNTIINKLQPQITSYLLCEVF